MNVLVCNVLLIIGVALCRADSSESEPEIHLDKPLSDIPLPPKRVQYPHYPGAESTDNASEDRERVKRATNPGRRSAAPAHGTYLTAIKDYWAVATLWNPVNYANFKVFSKELFTWKVNLWWAHMMCGCIGAMLAYGIILQISRKITFWTRYSLYFVCIAVFLTIDPMKALNSGGALIAAVGVSALMCQNASNPHKLAAAIAVIFSFFVIGQASAAEAVGFHNRTL
jgi:hypothetical protein